MVLTGRRADKLSKLSTGLKEEGHTVEAASLDASDPKAVQWLVEDLVSRHGSVDVVHYNAASLRQATIEQQPADTFAPDLSVNIGGAMVLIQSVIPSMAARGGGTILLTGGRFAFHPSPEYISLSIGNAGLRTLALGLFESLKAKGIHIGIVNVTAIVAAGSQTSINIADVFWELHNSPREAWVAEAAYSE